MLRLLATLTSIVSAVVQPTTGLVSSHILKTPCWLNSLPHCITWRYHSAHTAFHHSLPNCTHNTFHHSLSTVPFYTHNISSPGGTILYTHFIPLCPPVSFCTHNVFHHSLSHCTIQHTQHFTAWWYHSLNTTFCHLVVPFSKHNILSPGGTIL